MADAQDEPGGPDEPNEDSALSSSSNSLRRRRRRCWESKRAVRGEGQGRADRDEGGDDNTALRAERGWETLNGRGKGERDEEEEPGGMLAGAAMETGREANVRHDGSDAMLRTAKNVGRTMLTILVVSI